MKDESRDNMQIGGRFHVQHLDKDGNLKGEYDMPNAIVDEGIEDLLAVAFDAGTQKTQWYIGLINNAGFTALDNGDDMAGIGTTNGWSEAGDGGGADDYDETTRPEWAPDAPATRAISNASTVDFSINTTITIFGIFITNIATKGGTTGTLWSTAGFTSTVDAENLDTLKVTYTVSG